MEKARFLDNIVPLIIGAVSFAASVLQIVGFALVVIRGPISSQLLWMVVLSQVCIFSLVGLTGYMFKSLRRDLREIEKLRFSVNEVFREFHQLCHKYRDVMCRTDGHQLKESGPFQEALDRLKAIFDKTTASDCSLCVKMFVDNEGHLLTVSRDSASQTVGGRDKAAQIEDSAKNYGLHSVMQKRMWFACNDLGGNPFYFNLNNPNWQSQYNSTIVVPVGYDDPQLGYVTQAFLCVDSQNRDVFNEKYHTHLLAAAGDMLQPLVHKYHNYLMEAHSAHAN